MHYARVVYSGGRIHLVMGTQAKRLIVDASLSQSSKTYSNKGLSKKNAKRIDRICYNTYLRSTMDHEQGLYINPFRHYREICDEEMEDFDEDYDE